VQRTLRFEVRRLTLLTREASRFVRVLRRELTGVRFAPCRSLHIQEKDDYAWLESADGEHEARPYIDAENRLAMRNNTHALHTSI
jgi:hypothetical protein